MHRLMAATKQYSEMRARAKSGKADPESKSLPPGAEEIRDIVMGSLRRSGRTDAEV